MVAHQQLAFVTQDSLPVVLLKAKILLHTAVSLPKSVKE